MLHSDQVCPPSLGYTVTVIHLVLVDVKVDVGSGSHEPQFVVVDGSALVLDHSDQVELLVATGVVLLFLPFHSLQAGSELVLVLDHSDQLLELVLSAGLLLVGSQVPHDGSVLVATGVVELHSDHVLSVVGSADLVVEDHSVQVGSALLVVASVELDQPSHPSAETEPRMAAVAAIVVVFILNLFPALKTLHR